ncbi:MAG: cytidylate kinase-like family protein [Clostridiales bacterium]|nr:cytidylate kinase-like family protein [Clostridiales bacterium]
MAIITISREYGAGGRSIGRRVAKELGIEIYDKDIIRNTVKESGLDASVIERNDEEISRTDSILRMITPSAYIDQREAIHNIERRFILMLAQKGDCIIVGRCADQILEEANIEALNVFIYADDIHRAVRVSHLIDSKNPTDIQRAMKKTDAARRNYYQQFSGKRWGDAANYNLCLDSGLLGYDTCVKLICDAARGLHSPSVEG